MSLQVKYRPTTLDQIAENDETVEALQKLLARKEGRPRAYLFTGTPGCGKTTLGRIVVKELGAEGPDYHELNAADFRGIDTARSIREQAGRKALLSPAKVWLIDEAHKLTTDAQEALLKLIEEPPEFCYFVLCTTNPTKLIATLKRRCTPFVVEALSADSISRYLKRVAKKEGKECKQKVRQQLARQADGSLGMALMLLDRIIDLPAKDQLKAAKKIETEEQDAIELCRMILKGAGWKKVATFLKEFEGDPEGFRRLMLGYFSSVLLSQGSLQAFKVLEIFAEPFYSTGKAGLITACFEAVSDMG